MDTIRMVAISGRGNSLFSSRMGDIWSQGSPFQGQSLGQGLSQGLGQGDANYARAKADIAQWDTLVVRLQHVANKTVRDQLASDYGVSAPSNSDKGQYTRDRLNENVLNAESYSPTNYLVFQAGDVKNRLARLDNFVSDFRHAVEQAETTYGTLPDAQVITNTITQKISELPPWVLPVGAGVVALGLLGAFGVIKI